jgi:hypothetical protein
VAWGVSSKTYNSDKGKPSQDGDETHEFDGVNEGSQRKRENNMKQYSPLCSRIIVRLNLFCDLVPDTDWCTGPNVIAVQERVPGQDLSTRDAVLRTDTVAGSTSHRVDGLRARRASRWNTDGGVDPDIIAVQEGVGIVDLGAGQAVLGTNGIASVPRDGPVGRHAAGLRRGRARRRARRGSTTRRNAD